MRSSRQAGVGLRQSERAIVISIGCLCTAIDAQSNHYRSCDGYDTYLHIERARCAAAALFLSHTASRLGVTFPAFTGLLVASETAAKQFVRA